MRWWPRQVKVDDQRWLVVDVESSGLDPQRDRLLAIAGVAVQRQDLGWTIDLADSFEVVLLQPADHPVDKTNILIHGIGVQAQRSGVPPTEALHAFERWVGQGVLVGFHSAFDKALIDRCSSQWLRRRMANPWLDLAELGPAVAPAGAASTAQRSLDDWMQRFGIECAVRHQAAADAHATAQLFLSLWPYVRRQWPQTTQAIAFRQVADLASRARWLPR